MSCCGKKRTQWKQETKSHSDGKSRINNDKPFVEDRSSKLFKYKGSSNLTIKGKSGKIYHFRFHGEKIQVD